MGTFFIAEIDIQRYRSDKSSAVGEGLFLVGWQRCASTLHAWCTHTHTSSIELKTCSQAWQTTFTTGDLGYDASGTHDVESFL